MHAILIVNGPLTKAAPSPSSSLVTCTAPTSKVFCTVATTAGVPVPALAASSRITTSAEVPGVTTAVPPLVRTLIAVEFEPPTSVSVIVHAAPTGSWV